MREFVAYLLAFWAILVAFFVVLALATGEREPTFFYTLVFIISAIVVAALVLEDMDRGNL